MDTLFSKTLRRVRESQGFPTAYRFVHDNGNGKGIGFTYRQYLRMEQGRSLPECGKLSGLLLALRLPAKSAAANELAVAWLKTLAGERVFRHIFSFVPVPAPEPGLSPMQHAVKNSLAGEKHYLSPEQFEAILTNRNTFLCYLALSNDTGLWPVDQLAKALELTRHNAQKALETLSAAKLLKEPRKGSYKCPSAGMMTEAPHLSAIDPTLTRKYREYQRDLTASGRSQYLRAGTIRADAESFRNFLPLMDLNISTAQTYSITKKTAGSALFYVEGRVLKLRDF